MAFYFSEFVHLGRQCLDISAGVERSVYWPRADVSEESRPGQLRTSADISASEATLEPRLDLADMCDVPRDGGGDDLFAICIYLIPARKCSVHGVKREWL
jgi:hypothetical protein